MHRGNNLIMDDLMVKLPTITRVEIYMHIHGDLHKLKATYILLLLLQLRRYPRRRVFIIDSKYDLYI